MPDHAPVIRGANPRRNLPSRFSRKRTESNFLCAFERAYRATVATAGIAGRDLEVSGYGIADWIWMGWRSPNGSGDATAYSLETLRALLRLYAFELKIADWRNALRQAFRYSYFADKAVVVVPPRTMKLARLHLAEFRRLRVGLWSFDVGSGNIRRIYTPRGFKARNEQARKKAITLILRRAQLSKSFKSIYSVSQGL